MAGNSIDKAINVAKNSSKRQLRLKQKSGFTLVELAIVLVIVGLLVGGVIQGQELINRARQSNIISQFNEIQTAITTYQLKYRAIPGDDKKATVYWGALDGGDGLGSDCTTATANGILTCNGDGNGQINYGTNEMLRFWQHLSNASLIKGSFNGSPQSSTAVTGASYATTVGVNVLESAYSGVGWGVFYNAPYSWSTVQRASNTLELGGNQSNHWNDLALMSAENTYEIDLKFDDGKPYSGVAYLIDVSEGVCVTTYVASTSEYVLNQAGTKCQPAYYLKL